MWAMKERGFDIPSFQGAYAGDVPLGSGLSSSAAIEAATAVVLDALFHLEMEKKELALLCQHAENVFVGVNSGIMDQYASLLCKEGMALLIDCRSLEAEQDRFVAAVDRLEDRREVAVTLLWPVANAPVGRTADAGRSKAMAR